MHTSLVAALALAADAFASTDADQDGFSTDTDCDDTRATVNPATIEVPDNGLDDDCVGGDVSLATALVINEIHYDPANGLDGDANRDGVRSASADEFVELVNVGAAALNLSGVTLWDTEKLAAPPATRVPNHRVPAGTVLQPNQALVVFGGGSPVGPFGNAVVQTATSADLNLNNTGDVLSVQDAGGTTRLSLDIEPLSNNPDEAYVRDPDLIGAFDQHLRQSPRRFSPGTKIDLTAFGAPIAGTGSFTFVPPGAPDKPLNVYYHLPASLTAESPIVFVFHGGTRVAETTRNAWIDAADTYGFAVFAPGFNDAYFPGVSGYHLGNVFLDGDAPTAETLQPESEWTFSLIEPLFDAVVDELGSAQPVFHAWGHSAGAQFLHRLVQFAPDLPCGYVVAANAGWYTVPDLAVDFPYGQGLTPLALEPPDGFGVDLTVHIGSEDNDQTDDELRRTPEADLQGTNRYDRAYYFIGESEALAAAAEVPFAWSLVEVPGVGHDQEAMAEFAGPWLAARIDPDGDGIDSRFDNCPRVANPDQSDVNGDGFADACRDPSASISAFATVDPSAILGARAIVRDRATVGADVVLGADALVGYDAVVAAGAVLGAGASVFDRAYVGPGAALGESATLGSDADLGAGAAVGDGTTLKDRANVEADANVGEDGWVGYDVRVGAGARVGDRTTLQDRVNVGANAVVGDDVLLRYGYAVADGAVVGNGVTLP